MNKKGRPTLTQGGKCKALKNAKLFLERGRYRVTEITQLSLGKEV